MLCYTSIGSVLCPYCLYTKMELSQHNLEDKVMGHPVLMISHLVIQPPSIFQEKCYPALQGEPSGRGRRYCHFIGICPLVYVKFKRSDRNLIIMSSRLCDYCPRSNGPPCIRVNSKFCFCIICGLVYKANYLIMRFTLYGDYTVYFPQVLESKYIFVFSSFRH